MLGTRFVAVGRQVLPATLKETSNDDQRKWYRNVVERDMTVQGDANAKRG